MFDQKQYVKEKILTKLEQSEDYDVKLSDSVSELLETVNVGLMPSRAEVFEEAVVGWVNFCNIVKDMILNGLELTKENFKNKFLESSNPRVEKAIERGPEEIDETLLDKEDPVEKAKRLISIAEESYEDKVIDDFDFDLLTEEGLRAAKLIDQNATAMDGDFIYPDSDRVVKYIRINKGDEIVSPYSGTKEIYQISYNRWLDIDTDQEFLVFFN
jgi:hypothetical protein